MKYVVVEIRNESVDMCSNHPSGFSTCHDNDGKKVGSTCVSVAYDDRVSAFHRATILTEDTIEFVKSSGLLNKDWYVFEYSGEQTVEIFKRDSATDEITSCVWLYHYSVVEVPETEEEIKKMEEWLDWKGVL